MSLAMDTYREMQTFTFKESNISPAGHMRTSANFGSVSTCLDKT
jgi:hypothetical protein